MSNYRVQFFVRERMPFYAVDRHDRTTNCCHCCCCCCSCCCCCCCCCSCYQHHCCCNRCKGGKGSRLLVRGCGLKDNTISRLAPRWLLDTHTHTQHKNRYTNHFRPSWYKTIKKVYPFMLFCSFQDYRSRTIVPRFQLVFGHPFDDASPCSKMVDEFSDIAPLIDRKSAAVQI